MTDLNINDRRHLSAAQGWIELGLHAEAEKELWQISPAYRQHPEFLEQHWHILAHRERWSDCLVVAKMILGQDTENAMGHIQLSESLLNIEGVQMAYDALRPAAEKITDSITIFYNLSCYACELGKIDEARKWLAKTFAEAKDSEYDGFYQRLAADDFQLKPLWSEISGIGC
jgi:predicted Zn-dependent protease